MDPVSDSVPEDYTIEEVLESFQELDLNRDNVIDWKQFELANLEVRHSGLSHRPSQVHLALTADVSQMHVTWVQNKHSELPTGYVYYGLDPNNLDSFAPAE